MASTIESYFVVVEKDDEQNEGAEYLTPDLAKLGKKYLPQVSAARFEELVLSLDPWALGVSIRRATKKDAENFQEDTELVAAAHEYTNLKDYTKRRECELADTILFNAYEQIQNATDLERFIEKTQLSTSQIEALNRRSSNLVNASDEWLDVFATYVAKKATNYKGKNGTTKRTKASVISDWKEGSSKEWRELQIRLGGGEASAA